MRVSQATTLMLFCCIVLFVSEAAFAPPILVYPTGIAGRMFTHVFTTGSAWLCLGIWVLATPEYVVAGHYRSRWFCWTIRAFAMLSFLCQFVLLPVLDLSRGWKLAAAFVAPVSIALTYRYLHNLAKRIPDNPLALHAALVAACLIVSNLMSHAAARLQFIWPTSLLRIPTNVQQLASALALAYAIFILARFSTRLTSAANRTMSNFLSETRDV
jgi:hypothetical protein